MKTKTHTFLALCLGAVFQATGFAQLPPPAAPKPPVGVPRDAKLFNGKWYKVMFEKVSWQSARDKCRSMGGQLVIIPDEVTWVFVKTLSPAEVWLGATDEKVEGLWMWVDGSPITFKAWLRDEPSNHYGKENWMTMVEGGWSDKDKSYPSVVGYICEWKHK